MPESRSVKFVLNLPCDLADEIEHFCETDPEFIERVLAYGLVRRAVFARLSRVNPLGWGCAPSFDSKLHSSIETS